MAVINISEKDFEAEVYASCIPVIVEFYAGWCTPCHKMGHVIEDMSDEMAGAAKFVRVDVMSEEELAGRFDIRNVPTVMVFRGGNVTDRIIGSTPRENLHRILTEA